MSTAAQAVLDFWFLPPSDHGHNHFRVEWFRKDDAFDAAIRARFAADVGGIEWTIACGGWC